MSEFQSLENITDGNADGLRYAPPEIDYADMVESYQKDHETNNLITQRIQLSINIKDAEEEKLNSIKNKRREVEFDNELIKNKVDEHSMLVYDWIKCDSENSKIEQHTKTLKQLEEDEIKLHLDHIKKLEDLNQKYVSLKASFEPKKLHSILNDLCEEELQIDKQIAEKENILTKLQTFNPDTVADIDLGPLNIAREELHQQLPHPYEKIKLEKKNKADQEYIEKLKIALKKNIN